MGFKSRTQNPSNGFIMTGDEVAINKQIKPTQIHGSGSHLQNSRVSNLNGLSGNNSFDGASSSGAYTPSSMARYKSYTPKPTIGRYYPLPEITTTPTGQPNANVQPQLQETSINYAETPEFISNTLPQQQSDPLSSDSRPKRLPKVRSHASLSSNEDYTQMQKRAVTQSNLHQYWSSGTESSIPSQLVASQSSALTTPVQKQTRRTSLRRRSPVGSFEIGQNRTQTRSLSYKRVFFDQDQNFSTPTHITPTQAQPHEFIIPKLGTSSTPLKKRSGSKKSLNLKRKGQDARFVQYKPYNLNDYNKIKHRKYNLGGLGNGNVGTKEWMQLKAKADRIKQYTQHINRRQHSIERDISKYYL